ncbi:putative ATP-binding protein [Vibrio crassostreae]|nr:putative ATP-binding protein [Vibrio crassostreae]CAK2772303.1 putative ATP-binding protein [Vibrio crassostreae]CAK3219921.1 putative ATP-binding protein [Vibrio crassostreae]CAK3840311.1 putative ATP-binding protein [Vibrio crassostreae]
MKKNIIIISSGNRNYREFLLEEISKHYNIYLVCNAEITWEVDYIKEYILVDRYTIEEVLDAINGALSKPTLQGVLTWDERYLLLTARVASELDLPNAGFDAVQASKDKHLGRNILAEKGLPQPKSIKCHCLDDVVSAANKMSFPVVLKPNSMGASMGVVKINSIQELFHHFELSKAQCTPGEINDDCALLVEEYIDGEEISVDGYVKDGKYKPLYVARKFKGGEPFFLEVKHVVDANDELLNSEGLIDSLKKAHQVLGFENVMTHSELKINDGSHVVVEINARLGGGNIPLIAKEAMGIQAGLVAAQVACGDIVDETTSRQKKSATIQFLYPRRKSKIFSIKLPNVMNAQVKYKLLSDVGSIVDVPPYDYFGRIAYCIAVDSDRVSSERLANEYMEKVEVDLVDFIED